MAGFQVNSPFTSLSQTLFSPQQTAAKTSNDVAGLGRNYNVRTMAKQQASNAGHFGNLAAMLSGQAGYDAQRNAMPMANQMQDSASNADWRLKTEGSSEQEGLAGLQHLMNAYNFNHGPLSHALSSAKFGFMNNMLGGGGLFGGGY